MAGVIITQTMNNHEMIIIKAGMTWQPKYVMVRESDNPTQGCVVGVITHILYVYNNYQGVV